MVYQQRKVYFDRLPPAAPAQYPVSHRRGEPCVRVQHTGFLRILPAPYSRHEYTQALILK